MDSVQDDLPISRYDPVTDAWKASETDDGPSLRDSTGDPNEGLAPPVTPKNSSRAPGESAAGEEEYEVCSLPGFVFQSEPLLPPAQSILWFAPRPLQTQQAAPRVLPNAAYRRPLSLLVAHDDSLGARWQAPPRYQPRTTGPPCGSPRSTSGMHPTISRPDLSEPQPEPRTPNPNPDWRPAARRH